jgi:uncharacterized membrane protein
MSGLLAYIKTTREGLRLPHVFITLAVLLISGLWLALTPEGLLGKTDAVGYAVCHRIDVRSFHLGERPLPLCARCTGMYLGSLTTFIFFSITTGRAGLYPNRGIIVTLLAGSIIWAFDGLNSFATLIPAAPQLYEPHNTLRLFTGSLIGIGLVTMIYPPFQQLAWREWKQARVIPGWPHFMALIVAVGVINLLVLTEQPLVLYPLAILSALGVLLLLTLAYGMIALQILKRESAASSTFELLFPLLLGFGLALLQIGGIDLLRYLMTGTWSGFHL